MNLDYIIRANGLSIEDKKQIETAINQIRLKGRISFEDFRQINSRLAGFSTSLSFVFNENITNAIELMKKEGIKSSVIDDVFNEYERFLKTK